jgi:hypothetical protein
MWLTLMLYTGWTLSMQSITTRRTFLRPYVVRGVGEKEKPGITEGRIPRSFSLTVKLPMAHTVRPWTKI